MANLPYPKAASAFLRGEIDWEGDSFVLAALDGSYGFDIADEFRSALTGVLGSEPLTGTAVLDDGIADADDTTVSGITTGLIVEAFAIYQDTGSSATDRLIAFYDTNADGTPISRTSDGTGMPVLWSNVPERVFKI